MSDEKEIRRLVLEFFAGNVEKADLWFKTPNPLLGGFVPERMIWLGRETRLLRFVRDQLDQNDQPESSSA
jgi:hypothetical protein